MRISHTYRGQSRLITNCSRTNTHSTSIHSLSGKAAQQKSRSATGASAFYWSLFTLGYNSLWFTSSRARKGRDMELYFAHINDASIVYDAITGRALAIVARIGDAARSFAWRT